MKKYRNLLIVLSIITSTIVVFLWFSKKPIPPAEAVKENPASPAKANPENYIDDTYKTKAQSSLPQNSNLLTKAARKNNESSDPKDSNFSKLSNEQFSLVIEKYSHELPKIIGKINLTPGGNSNNDAVDLKNKAYEGDPGAQFLYAKRLSLSLIEELSKEDAETKGHADIAKWLARHEEARSFLIESAVATGNGSAMAHLGVIYGLAPISDNIEALAWSMISQNMGYPGVINICASSINPCTADQFITAQTRAKNYLNIYSFNLEK